MKWNKKEILKYIIPFLIGGVVVYFLMPEKVIYETKVEKEKKEEKESEEKETEERVKIKYRNKIIREKVKTVTRKITFPDGKIIEEEIYESESEQIDRLLEQERKKYEQIITKKESEYQKKMRDMRLTVENKKRFTLHGGFQTDLDSFSLNESFVVGASMDIFGPIVFTTTFNTSTAQVQALAGFKF